MNYDLDEMFALLRDIVHSDGDGGIQYHDVDLALRHLDWLEDRVRLMRSMGYA